MTEKATKSKLIEKVKIAENKAKKLADYTKEIQRKQKIISDKSREIELLKDQVSELKVKAETAAKVQTMNSELVTRKCGLESAVVAKDKTIQELQAKVNMLENSLRERESVSARERTERPHRSVAIVAAPKPKTTQSPSKSLKKASTLKVPETKASKEKHSD